jgi:hypothetical protein
VIGLRDIADILMKPFDTKVLVLVVEKAVGKAKND